MIDFNEVKNISNLIPQNTIAKAVLEIRHGNYAPNPLLTESKTGSIYLDTQFTIVDDEYARRKVFYKIGIDGNPKWVAAGKIMIKSILESAKNIKPSDTSEKAQKARIISGYEDLEGLEVVIKIGIESDPTGVYEDRNTIVAIITPENPIYSNYNVGWY